MIVTKSSDKAKLYYQMTTGESAIVVNPDKKKAYQFEDSEHGLELATEVAEMIDGRIEERTNELMLEIASEKRWIRCTYEEMLSLIEFLFLHDSGFEVTEVNSSKNECTLFLK